MLKKTKTTTEEVKDRPLKVSKTTLQNLKKIKAELDYKTYDEVLAKEFIPNFLNNLRRKDEL